MKTDILSLLPHEIAAFFPREASYRAAQIFGHLHKNHATSFDAMQNLPKSLRRELDDNFFITPISVVETQTSRDETVKFLTRLGNDTLVESVLMRYKLGNSVCISTQAGCKMGCKFCASAGNFHRDLTAGEYCLQVYNADNPKNVVLMGCGEPLDNFDATTRFIELITHEKGKNLGARHITVSTCGLVPQIYALANMRLQINLAISLHAPTDELRAEFMPVAKKYPLDELLAACRAYAEKTHRRLTFEYALSAGKNDSPSHARALAKLLRGILCHVNLIPVNSTNPGFSPAPPQEIKKFAAILAEKNIPVTVRRSLGSDIDAACGQLRARHQ
ncbi:MAG: 23S rRNA (adenine(2503)-C(2))-methyltransferase RlmN [Defluviitaleaceae bacterium]|nr:23S rRNA (adenine(2503)-C(2))-methyltransferase RlmN [Defluviitaleaceae bacterium]